MSTAGPVCWIACGRLPQVINRVGCRSIAAGTTGDKAIARGAGIDVQEVMLCRGEIDE